MSDYCKLSVSGIDNDNRLLGMCVSDNLYYVNHMQRLCQVTT